MAHPWHDELIPYESRAAAAADENDRLDRLASASRSEAQRLRDLGHDVLAEQAEEEARAFDALHVTAKR